VIDVSTPESPKQAAVDAVGVGCAEPRQNVLDEGSSRVDLAEAGVSERQISSRTFRNRVFRGEAGSDVEERPSDANCGF
jgi:hypothetical protein